MAFNTRPRVEHQRVTIFTVDPAQRKIEGRLRDGAIAHIAVFDTPPLFRWPKQGEVWSIVKQGLEWRLGDLVTAADAFSDLDPGEARLDADVLYDKSGNQYVTNADVSAGEDKTYVHDQTVAASTWNVAHNLDKFPSVSVIDSTNALVIANITYVDENSVTVSFTAPATGKAFCN